MWASAFSTTTPTSTEANPFASSLSTINSIKRIYVKLSIKEIFYNLGTSRSWTYGIMMFMTRQAEYVLSEEGLLDNSEADINIMDDT